MEMGDVPRMEVRDKVLIIKSHHSDQSMSDKYIGKTGTINSIHKTLKGNLCYVEIDDSITIFPLYEDELEVIE